MRQKYTRTNSQTNDEAVRMSASPTSSALSVQSLALNFGSFAAIRNVSFDVAAGSFVSIVGPSGCGKSSLLNMIAGLLEPSEGCIEIFGQRLTGINRRAAYMFQQDALLPWKTVLANVQFGLNLRGQNGPDAIQKSRDWIERVGLKGFADHYPYQLSGGMKKRAAMAQCWIVEPDMILMDEPFSALDVHTRLRMEQEILNLWSRSNQTVIFVTHDLDEAIALSDEVLLLSASPESRVVGRYFIDLPRPRNLIDLKAESRFHELYQTIWEDLRKEVLKTDERTVS
jgi:NitT/TauT family transport system ATP-binding protein